MADKIDVDVIRKLVETASANGVEELSVAFGDYKIEVKRSFGAGSAAPVFQTATAPVCAGPAEKPIADGHRIESPLAGVFYRASSPDAPPYTEKGARVRRGDTLCIIEAMKMMNEIPSDVDGVVTAIPADNGAAVAAGDVIFVIKAD